MLLLHLKIAKLNFYLIDSYTAFFIFIDGYLIIASYIQTLTHSPNNRNNTRSNYFITFAASYSKLHFTRFSLVMI